MTAKDFPPHHLIHKDAQGYLVQKFIDTGERVSDNRVSTFFGRVLYANCATAKTPRPALSQLGFDVHNNTISSLVMESDWRWHSDEDTLQLAQKVHAAFPGNSAARHGYTPRGGNRKALCSRVQSRRQYLALLVPHGAGVAAQNRTKPRRLER